MIHTHQTAPTQFVEANGIRFAYRRFGKTGGIPIVLNQHYIGTMDYWDPTVTDGLARDREVIPFNNAGVSSSSGEVPTTFEPMGANAIAFIKALGLSKVDVLGFSIGGMVAQEITLQAPDLVRKLILVGTGPRGGQGLRQNGRHRDRVTRIRNPRLGSPHLKGGCHVRTCRTEAQDSEDSGPRSPNQRRAQRESGRGDGGRPYCGRYAEGVDAPRGELPSCPIHPAHHATYCPYKGDCAYYSIPLGGARCTNTVWTYDLRTRR